MTAVAGDPILSHHFDDQEQQHESSRLGMWAFLATEVMFFGGLIAAYAVYRLNDAEAARLSRAHELPAFALASRHLNVGLGALNTVVLLVSSLTMALAVRAAQLRRVVPTVQYLLLTMALGTMFLGIKAIEYTADYHEDLIPGLNFNWTKAQAHRGVQDPTPGPNRDRLPYAQAPPRGRNINAEQTVPPQAARAQLFFVLYFFMTGLHAIHLIIGIALVGIIAWLAWRGWFSGGGATQVEMTGLYWHFIDIVWVFLYPLLYLIDVHK